MTVFSVYVYRISELKPRIFCSPVTKRQTADRSIGSELIHNKMINSFKRDSGWSGSQSCLGSPVEGALVPTSPSSLRLCLLGKWECASGLTAENYHALLPNAWTEINTVSMPQELCVCIRACVWSVKSKRHIVCLNSLSAARPHSRPAAAFISTSGLFLIFAIPKVF